VVACPAIRRSTSASTAAWNSCCCLTCSRSTRADRARSARTETTGIPMMAIATQTPASAATSEVSRHGDGSMPAGAQHHRHAIEPPGHGVHGGGEAAPGTTTVREWAGGEGGIRTHEPEGLRSSSSVDGFRGRPGALSRTPHVPVQRPCAVAPTAPLLLPAVGRLSTSGPSGIRVGGVARPPSGCRGPTPAFSRNSIPAREWRRDGACDHPATAGPSRPTPLPRLDRRFHHHQRKTKEPAGLLHSPVGGTMSVVAPPDLSPASR
jgi:hypothetical protein